jgi:hypothetical protein
MNKPFWTSASVLGVGLIGGLGLVGCAVDRSPVTDFEADAEFIDSTESELLPAGCSALGSTVLAHACSHGPVGPFASKTGSSNANFAGSTPKFDAIHTFYTVTLPSAGGGIYRGTLKYTPANNDDHIVYVNPAVAVTVKDKSGAVVNSQLSSSFSDCPTYLTNYSVHELKTSSTFAPYKLTFEATTSTIKVLLEEVAPLRARWYQDADADGYGPLTPSQLTACLPSAGYTTTVAGDCNDSNASVYPGSGCP